MTSVNAVPQLDNTIDDHVDGNIVSYFNLKRPKSFFLFAGAGSGKTRTLVNSLKTFLKENDRQLRLNGRRIAVITFTNAACEEIKDRLEFHPAVSVSTIHSFLWSMIKGFNSDIGEWLASDLRETIAELEEKQAKSKNPTTKTYIDRAKSIEAKRQRLEQLSEIQEFTYNPNGENRERDSLDHSEVIKIGSTFLEREPLMQEILVARHPILLIDECQDTNKLLVGALYAIQARFPEKFCLGLIGDTMQRIYTDGRQDLGTYTPDGWAKPAKVMNHRSPKRVVQLINKIRSQVDTQQQQPRTDAEAGTVRLYICKSDSQDKAAVERSIMLAMSEETGDPLWSGAGADVKALVLEHHMAARRMGFLPMFEPLHSSSRLKTSLLDGTLSALRLFSELILPLKTAALAQDEFTVALIVRRASPLLGKRTLQADGNTQLNQLAKAETAVSHLLELWDNGGDPTFMDVLLNVAGSGLFSIPDALIPIVRRKTDTTQEELERLFKELGQADEQDEASPLDHWDRFLQTPFSQIESYRSYVAGTAPFDTHQGVKGLQYPRVMVVMDDAEAKGFLFAYDKLFGVKEPSDTDRKNEADGADTSITRTLRLFYVTCSRAQKSLALVAYTSDPEGLKKNVIEAGWFEDHEVIVHD
ncbi:UvrD-helicase domain-containing protein [Kordiimonas marina]|uniref:UvrD-helicase domain-containing protein n=1 Tax=Kordiimonas marina TaxID=2872312 RepID=UPI001FF2CCF7|nr:UvrD-helicase domain-containing protein [Kordiimonas marina]MCJ9429665.1 UvrD-helicase domain-containing protein [Kordiimonas marina]